jgi:hypothetical protein
LFSINRNAITKYIYKDYIKQVYNKKYELTKINKNKETSSNKQDVLIILTLIDKLFLGCWCSEFFI